MKKRLALGAGFDFAKIITFSVLFLIFSLTGCSSGGGGGGTSNGSQSQDAILYQQALDKYQAGNYTQALTDFQALVAQYANSIYVDNSQYYTARCHHELQDFDTARSEYVTFTVNYATSNYVDNAVFYHGKSYYDEAQLQTNAQTEFPLLQSAITQLQEYTLSYPTES
ncbi:MAG: outer membrane protein assembly factor BamD, partial [Gammaproteobacteria bacterium]|nr:outer membrane protein assembly factor BamD [Gammaproteobacteria bacterium]